MLYSAAISKAKYNFQIEESACKVANLLHKRFDIELDLACTKKKYGLKFEGFEVQNCLFDEL